MTSSPRDADYRAPTSADAARMLAEITPVTRRSRRLARDVTFARPLLAWGLAWTTGAILFQYLPSPGGAIAGSAACATAAATTWLVRPREVRLNHERRFTLLWMVLLACSPFLVAVAQPGNSHVLALFLGSVWAVGMLLYGIGVQDLPLAAIGLGILLAAAATRIGAPHQAMGIVGVAGGLAMASLGGWRMRWKR